MYMHMHTNNKLRVRIAFDFLMIYRKVSPMSQDPDNATVVAKSRDIQQY